MIARWTRDLIFGARLSWAGGRDGWIRTAMTAVGVGLGVAMLLAASAIPAMLQALHDRSVARNFAASGSPPARSDRTLTVRWIETAFRDISIRGLALQPDGSGAPVPPGVDRLPRPGEMVVSPALAELLSTPDGALLAKRLPYRIVGTIGDQGLLGPREYAVYLGSDRIAGRGDAYRIDRFGDPGAPEGWSPQLVILVVIIFVVLLLPIGVFIAAAIRFGDERRDRRLAAIRLVGADSRMARRIAAGEALNSAVLGVLAGALFFGVGIGFVERITLAGISVFTSDVRPDPMFAALVVLAVPAAAVGVTLLTLRRVAIEPLGVVRRSGGSRRRLWWRLVLPVLGLALLYPLVGRVAAPGARLNTYQIAAGAVLLLASVVTLLPWLIEGVVRRLRGGGVAWQLAIRRLQLGSGTAARVVSGIAVAVAGGIALQMLFSAAAEASVSRTGQDPSRVQVQVVYGPDDSAASTAENTAKFHATPGVRSVISVVRYYGEDPSAQPDASGQRPFVGVVVGDCQSLAEMAAIDRCADGDVFLVDKQGTDGAMAAAPRPGLRVRIHSVDWTVPAAARAARPRRDPMGVVSGGIFATPGAAGVASLPRADVETLLRLDPAVPDVHEHVRDTAFGISPYAHVNDLRAARESNRFTNIRHGLFAGLVITLLLIGASLLVSTLEQLRERRRLLAVLVAVGARRATMGWSVLWQAAVPVLLGLGLAVVAGVGLGAVLLAMVGEPLRFDWASMAGIAGVAAAVVLLVTALSLPALWRLMRPGALRTE